MPRKTGILTLLFTDTEPVDHTLYATLSVNLSLSIEALEEAHPDAYGLRKFFPGVQSWEADNKFNEAIDAAGDRNATHVAFETLAMTRESFAVLFTSAVGNTYAGTAWISSYNYNSADETIYQASVSLVGKGELVLVQNIPSPLTDPEDLILLLPESLTYAVGGVATLWENLGSIGALGDLDSVPSYATEGAPSDCQEDAVMGSVMGFGVGFPVYEALATTSINVVPTISGANDDSEMWMVIKIPVGEGGVIAAWNSESCGNSTYWNTGAGILYFTFNAVTYCTSPGVFDDGLWHVVRTTHNLSQDSVAMEVDGYVLDSDNTPSGSLGCLPTNRFSLGDIYAAGVACDGLQVSMVKLVEGIFTEGRTRAIYAYLRDTWLITGIPADGTPTGSIHGFPLYGDLKRWAWFTGSNYSTLDNQTGSVRIAYQVRKDDTNEYVYYLEGGAGTARVKRTGYNGSAVTYVSTTSPGGTKYGRGLAINILGGECYQTLGNSGGTGPAMYSHSLDPADAADAWTELIATGTYEMHGTVEYNPTDGLIYFIDSLAATPTLRSITTAGASDTLVKSLTAGKVYKLMTKDPDANVLYFSNDTDGTIETYNITTDTWTTAWLTGASAIRGIDIQNSKLWYVELTSQKVYEVTLAAPGSPTEKADWSGIGAGADGIWGCAVIVFDTTA